MPAPACRGCGESAPLIPGRVVPRHELPAPVATVEYCAGCWEAIDGADPVTGAYGAAAVDVARAPEGEGVAVNRCRFCARLFWITQANVDDAAPEYGPDAFGAIDGCAECVDGKGLDVLLPHQWETLMVSPPCGGTRHSTAGRRA